jgi:hypothetical protein
MRERELPRRLIWFKAWWWLWWCRVSEEYGWGANLKRKWGERERGLLLLWLCSWCFFLFSILSQTHFLCYVNHDRFHPLTPLSLGINVTPPS